MTLSRHTRSCATPNSASPAAVARSTAGPAEMPAAPATPADCQRETGGGDYEQSAEREQPRIGPLDSR